MIMLNPQKNWEVDETGEVFALEGKADDDMKGIQYRKVVLQKNRTYLNIQNKVIGNDNHIEVCDYGDLGASIRLWVETEIDGEETVVSATSLFSHEDLKRLANDIIQTL